MEIELIPTTQELLEARTERPYTALAGANNSGKSLWLKHLKRSLGSSAYMVGTNRFYHVYHFQNMLRDPNQLQQFEHQFQAQFNQRETNHEQNFIDLQQVIVGLNDTQRDLLFTTCGALLGNRFELKKTDESNDLSMRYIDMDGENLSVGSTGARLLMTTIGICMDERFSTVLIDEPELGLGPRVQDALARMFEDPAARERVFPHLERIIVATHSHLFLARRELRDNLVVSKNGSTVSAEAIDSVAEFHRLQFNLLGNSFESLFLPSAIVVVEGKTDHKYVEQLFRARLSDRRITVASGQGDVKRVVTGLRTTFGDLDSTPFRNRLFVVLDSVHQPSLLADLIGMGVLEENVVTWAQNGIEYLYPPQILSEIFHCAPEGLGEMTIEGDLVRVGDVSRTKSALCDEVVGRMQADTEIPAELTEKLLDLVSAAID